MKPRNSRCYSFLPALAVITLSAPSLFAANIVMSGTDAAGANSFTNGTNWTGGAAPTAGNTYQTGTFRIRTANNATNQLFAGDSLEITSGGDWRNKTAATVTVNNLILANNAVVELSQPNNQNGAGSVGTLAGNISLASGTAVLMAGNSTDSPLHVFTISSAISGSGGFTTGNASRNLLGASPPTAQSNGTVILTGDNSFTGGAASNGLTGSILRLGNANAVKNSTLTVSIANGLAFSSGIGTFNLGGLAGAQNIALADTAAAAVTLNVGGGINNNSSTYSGILSGTGGGLTKSGSGTLTLTNANTYTGATNVSAGTLVVNGNQSTATGNVSVTGTLAGNGGTIGGNTTINAGGKLALGDGTAKSIGTETFTGTLAFASTSIFEWDLNAPTADGAGPNQGSYDKVVNNNASQMSGTSVFNVVLGTGDSFADAFWNTSKTWTDIFSGTALPTDLSAIFTSFSGTGIVNNAGVGVVAGRGEFSFGSTNTLTWTAVPEPTSALAGLLITAGLLRRRRAA